MSREQIYNAILQLSELKQVHRDALITDRGFSDATIDKYKFRSSGPYLAKLDELAAKFPEEELIGTGAFIHDGQRARVNPILLEDRIIIPYLNRNGDCYLIRPHKLGLSGIPIEIYQEMNLEGNPSEIIITEGEFKAVAGMQWGIPTIAVPGISSFSEIHFPRLVKLLNDYGVRKITIIFDNEVKDDPAFPERFKDNPSDRYDTQFYAYYMAQKLEKEGKECRIGTLPDGWRVKGKIDLDGACAQLKTAGDIKRVIYTAKTRAEFLQELTSEAKQVILRKTAQKRHRSNIRREFGHYVASRKRGKVEWDEVISNFVIKIIATHHSPEGMIREVQFVNEFGQFSGTFQMPPEAMAGSDGFSTFCIGRGNFVWRGNKDDLATIWESEFLMDDGRHIIEPDHIGWVESEKIWLFGNIAIDTEGKELRPDKNHVVWMEKKGIKAIPLGVTTGKTVISEGIPYLNLTEFKASEIKTRLEGAIGKNQARICLGWVTASLFLEEVFDKYGCFPFLFITGRRGSGKSTVAEWLMNFYGLENAGKTASDTTQVGIQRYLSYYASLPVYLDEFRNTKNITQKTGFLRNAYNRQSSGKGIKADFGLREAKVRGTLIIAGEETPEDNALQSRSIIITVSEKHRTENHFKWFMANRLKFSYHTYDILKRKRLLVQEFIHTLDVAKEHLVEAGADDRTAINYAIMAAGYVAAFGDNDIDFAEWITVEAKRIHDENQEEQAIGIFLQDLVALKTDGQITKRYWTIFDGRIYLYFHGLYSVFSREYRRSRGIEPFKAASLMEYLKEEPGFLGSRVNHRIEGEMRSCVVFDEATCPEPIRHLIDEPISV